MIAWEMQLPSDFSSQSMLTMGNNRNERCGMNLEIFAAATTRNTRQRSDQADDRCRTHVKDHAMKHPVQDMTDQLEAADRTAAVALGFELDLLRWTPTTHWVKWPD